jgi:hypothetical protein
MSAASKAARAAARKQSDTLEVTAVDFDENSGKVAITVQGAHRAIPGMQAEIDPETMQVLANHRAIALVADDGGFRLVTLDLPPSVLEAHALRISEPEVLPVQLALAHQALDDFARNAHLEDLGMHGGRRECPQCGVAALVPHPTKPVDLCANGLCNARIERGEA